MSFTAGPPRRKFCKFGQQKKPICRAIWSLICEKSLNETKIKPQFNYVLLPSCSFMLFSIQHHVVSPASNCHYKIIFNALNCYVKSCNPSTKKSPPEVTRCGTIFGHCLAAICLALWQHFIALANISAPHSVGHKSQASSLASICSHWQKKRPKTTLWREDKIVAKLLKSGCLAGDQSYTMPNQLGALCQ